MARPSAKLKLSETELTELQTIIRSTKVESRLKQRAMIIMDWQAEKGYDETQELRKVSRRVFAKWRNRFKVNRMDELKDASRSGKPLTITEAQKNQVVNIAWP